MIPRLGLALALLLTTCAGANAQPTEISVYFPVVVGGPVTKIIDKLAADFEKDNPGVKVKPVYTGSYVETIGKALAAVKSGEPPQAAVMLSADI